MEPKLIAAEPGWLDRHYPGAPRVLHFAGDGTYSGTECTVTDQELCTVLWQRYRDGTLEVAGWANSLYSFTAPNTLSRSQLSDYQWQGIRDSQITGCDGVKKYCYRVDPTPDGSYQLVRTRMATGQQEVVLVGTDQVGRGNFIGLAVDGAGNVYIPTYVGFSDDAIGRVAIDGTYSIVAGGAAARSRDYGSAAQDFDFFNIHGLAFDSAGNLFVSEASTGSVVEITGLGDMAPPVPDPQTLGPCDLLDGVAVNPTACRADPVNTATGSYITRELDAQLGGTGERFAFERFYSSADPASGPLGPGWAVSYTASLSFPNASTAVFRGETGQQVLFTRNGTGPWRGAAGTRADLTSVPDGYLLTLRDGRAYTFTSAGKLTSVADHNGRRLQVAYDAAGRLDRVTDPVGRVVTFTSNAAGLLTGLALPDGRTVSYGYTNGRLTSVRALGGGVTTYTYDASGRLATIADANQHIHIQNVYDDAGRIVSQKDALGNVSRFAWFPATQTSVLTDAAGATWVDDYDNNVLKRTVDPLGNLSLYTYDRDLNVVAVTQDSTSPPPAPEEPDLLEYVLTLQVFAPAPPPRTRTTYFSYDTRGNLIARRAPDPLGYTETWTYDASDRPLTATDGRGGKTTLTYDAKGNVLSRQAPGRPIARFTYEDAGRLATMTTPGGSSTSFGYDAAGNLSTITDAVAGVTTITYDSAGRVLTRTSPAGNKPGGDPLAHRWTWAYQAANLLISETTPAGSSTTFDYDPVGNLIAVHHPDGGVTEVGYDAANQKTSEKDPDGDIATWGYDERGLLVRSTSPEGRTRRWSYDLARRVQTTIDPTGNAPGADPAAHTWRFAYDIFGNLSSSTDPAGGASRYDYDAVDRLTREVDPLQLATSYAYDANGNLTRVTDPSGAVTAYAYDAADRLERTTDPMGGVTRRAYDNDGNLLSITTPLGVKTTHTYDAAGRRTASVAPAGNQAGADPARFRTTYSYDADGNLQARRDPTGATITTEYDGLGRPVSSTDPMAAVTRYHYDAAGRLESVTDPLSQSTTWVHDLDGDPRSRTDANGHTTTWSYDRDGLARAMTLPGGQTWSYEHDANGNVRRVSAPNGKVTTYGHDALDRLVSADYSDTTPDIGYTYDAGGRVVTVTDGSGQRKLTYDGAGRVTSEQRDATDAIGYQYDANGRVTRRAYPGGVAVDYAHDADGRLLTVTPNLGGQTSYQYDANGNLSRTAYPDGYLDARTYDATDRVATIAHSRAGQALNNIAYERDPNGRPTLVTQTAGPRGRYSYDAAGRLTDVCYAEPCLAASAQIHYEYDAVGNRLKESRPGTTTTYEYDLNDRLRQRSSAAGTVTASHDANGNLTRLGEVTFSYDAEDRLIGVTTPQTAETYAHDAEGDRVRTSSTNRALNVTTDTYFRWDRNLAVPQVAAQGPLAKAPAQVHLYGNGRIATLAATVPTYYLTDGLGSVTTSTDANHLLYRDYAYEPFGAVRTATGSLGAQESQYGFAGEHLNRNTNLYHLRARDLDPTTGRFLTVDPLPDPYGTAHRSSYVYANNLPTVYVDPLGLRAECGGGLRQGTVDFAATILDNLTFGFTGGHEGVCVNQNGPGAYAARGVIVLSTLAAPLKALANARGAAAGLEALEATALRGGSQARAVNASPAAAGGGRPLLWTSWQSYPTITVGGREYARIGDRLYTRHAVDRLQPSGLGAPAGATGPGRSISPNYVEDVISNGPGVPVKGPHGEARLSFTSGSVQVITEDGIVVTVITR